VLGVRPPDLARRVCRVPLARTVYAVARALWLSCPVERAASAAARCGAPSCVRLSVELGVLEAEDEQLDRPDCHVAFLSFVGMPVSSVASLARGGIAHTG